MNVIRLNNEERSLLLNNDSVVCSTNKGRAYTKIEYSLTVSFARTALMICTLGISRLIANYCFETALESDNISNAITAVKWGARDYLEANEIRALAYKEKNESLKFLLAQIKFDKSSPDGGSLEAFEFISARDNPSNYKDFEKQNTSIKKIFTEELMPRVYFYKLEIETSVQGCYDSQAEVAYRFGFLRPIRERLTIQKKANHIYANRVFLLEEQQIKNNFSNIFYN